MRCGFVGDVWLTRQRYSSNLLEIYGLRVGHTSPTDWAYMSDKLDVLILCSKEVYPSRKRLFSIIRDVWIDVSPYLLGKYRISLANFQPICPQGLKIAFFDRVEIQIVNLLIHGNVPCGRITTGTIRNIRRL